MSDDKKGSSYERVYALLAATHEAVAIKSRVKHQLDTVCIKEWEFELQDGDRPSVLARFKTHLPYHSFTLDNCRLEAYRLVGHDELQAIVENHFGRDVPTFFCRKSTVLEGCTRERGRAEAKSFSTWFLTQIEKDFVPIQNAAQARLLEAARAVAKTPDFLAEEQASLLRYCHDEIVGVMSKYSFLGEDVLKNAIREYVASDVMGS